MEESLHLEVDDTTFLENFPDRHFRIGHHLADHPLLTLDRLLELGRGLPQHLVEYNGGNVDVCQDPATTPHTGLSLEDTLRTIDTAGSWVVLKYIEIDPEYRQLLYECVGEFAHMAEIRRDGVHQLECYVFITSPGSVTPYHFDDEHNFLLQIRGWKEMSVWHHDTAGAVTPEDLERYYLGGPRNLPYRPAVDMPDDVYRLDPGQGLHVPVHTSHWVQNGDEASISFSITFRSRPLAREANVHWFNGKMRGFGLSPRPFGRSALIDASKHRLARLARRSAGPIRQY